MSTFTTPADLRVLDSFKFELLNSFDYHVGEYPSTEVISVPKGFITDLASVPRVFWSVFPPHGKYAKAAIIHDYLYEYRIFSRKRADDIFLEAMEVLGVAKWRRLSMYWAVRLGGESAWKGKK